MLKRPLVIAGALVLSACSSASLDRLGDSLPGVYRMDIHQGNIVTQEMVDQLKPGMNQRQVAFILGTPLVKDPFHDERWDYLYSNEPGGKVRMQKRITLVFEKDELASLQGDFKPGDLPSIEPNKEVTVNIPKIEREKTLWETLTGVFTK
ncbi:outer membrane protein assembly factor BamE [Methylococcus sp. EFPC2]|uniref:outer membrane protein assembly factor BamE n=1 Tax=Methylococcus sp. EFPC2 TaxID=2812648 RepID=UPI001F07A512|nr:outer membrane protein assembly factor BamE [Methylococcus sp. EFPC2]